MDSDGFSWNAGLNLTFDDKHILETNERLNDKIIDAAQKLFVEQYGANEPETPLLCQSIGFAPTSHQSVQIHFDPEKVTG